MGTPPDHVLYKHGTQGIRINYGGGEFQIDVGDNASIDLAVRVDLNEILDPQGQAFIGFMSTTGAIPTITRLTAWSMGPANCLASIFAQPSEQFACIGGNAEFNVAARGLGLGYQWKRDGEPVPNGNSPRLQLSNLTAADEGLYSCDIIFCNGTVLPSTSAPLHIGLPIITRQPDNMSVCENVTPVLRVLPADARLRYQWQLNGEDIVGATVSTLAVSSPRLPLTGEYRCRVSLPCGEAEFSRTVLVERNPFPVVQSVTGTEGVCPGDTATLEVLATGHGLTY